MFEAVEHFFEQLVNYGILALEFIGVIIILVNAVQCVVKMIQKKEDARMELAEGIETALEFKLGGEVLRTVVVREVQDLIMVAAIMALRAGITFLLHWEIKNEKLAHDRMLPR